MKYTVELEEGVWLDTGDGDPSRTLRQEKAARFDTTTDAVKAVMAARKFRPFKEATIHNEWEPHELSTKESK